MEGHLQAPAVPARGPHVNNNSAVVHTAYAAGGEQKPTPNPKPQDVNPSSGPGNRSDGH